MVTWNMDFSTQGKNTTPEATPAGDNTATKSAKNETSDTYDHVGAMHFIIATVLVYSILGVFCVLLSRVKRVRGKSHEHYLHDESISRYLKSEKALKIDGNKMKLMYECALISERVKRFEEMKRFKELEKGFSSDFKRESETKSQHKKKKRRKRDVRNALGLMGASFFYIGSGSNESLDTNSPVRVPADCDIHTPAEKCVRVPRSFSDSELEVYQINEPYDFCIKDSKDCREILI